MIDSIPALLARTAAATPHATALVDRERRCDYATLLERVERASAALRGMGLAHQARVALYLDKTEECVVALLAAWHAGFISVPVNPKLKPAQVAHILADSGATALVSTRFRWQGLAEVMPAPALHVVLVDGVGAAPPGAACASLHGWAGWTGAAVLPGPARPRASDSDLAALLYTSGSTGMPKGVALSHRNLVAGCESVNAYLHTGPADIVLGLLPLSFDAGLSQLTTSIAAGATLVLHNYLRAQDVPPLCARHGVTSITAVPPLWIQLASAPWPAEATARLRLFANTGGHMPDTLLASLRRLFPRARPFLMYGLTEAFRSTYLDPDQVDRRPDSIGQAIPNCEILVLRPDGSVCDDDEPGELVHVGAHVAQGYWNDPVRTAERFRPLPRTLANGLLPRMAVWSGDLVRRDAEGYLYFLGRRDEQIKVSGYRVSPTEIESVLMALDGVREAVVFGVPDEQLGQMPVAMVALHDPAIDAARVATHCGRHLPSYMVPRIVLQAELARSANGKFDRNALRASFLAEAGAALTT